MWGFGIIISLLVSIAAIAGSTRAKTAEVEQKLLDHIEWGFTENARNQIERNELEDAIDELKEALNDYPRDD